MKTLKIYDTPMLELQMVVSQKGFAQSVTGSNEGFIWDDDTIITL